MQLLIFSVYDKAVQAFLQPFFCRTKGEALRSFSDACNDHQHQFFKHAADYSLMYLGEFEDRSGVFRCLDAERVISAVECVADDPFPPPARNGGGFVTKEGKDA